MSALANEPVWSDLQVSCLQAMGHTVYLDRATAEALPAPVDVADSAPVSATVRQQRVPPVEAAAAPLPRRSAPTAPAEPTRAPNTAPAAAPQRRSRVGLPDRLQMALLRASGCNPGDASTQALMASWPLAELRGNPAAKRALWPQLRALRRRQGPA
ncbi:MULTISPECIES: alanine acetyltransferase [Xanthomonas]|uniref:Alanine acetyltransferase n=1 Tax=Xanthomonas cucurbitae TaxID=56453 RepID=A0A2S7DVY4_9XANT|nr:alanine acetyltransferase [Xanthomonas cucurbitae]PPU77940.1 alanine acetyltransferase [Xanthomonas cucurbitae]QHG86020.1 alanine acetyltransferase [Xanthomonas cucurbitae]WDM68262.1 alanine acetyltransferase [Xanthomonas cucurbitae]WDM72135.1 alanine acetyltransferase [Xanthomonas cucurbitae]WDM75933.1 alanine acetyltransferase [Xanthomonas cucurbitae]